MKKEVIISDPTDGISIALQLFARDAYKFPSFVDFASVIPFRGGERAFLDEDEIKFLRVLMKTLFSKTLLFLVT